MGRTGWGGIPPGEPERVDRKFLFMTCDCEDFERGALTGMDKTMFERRSERLDTISITEADDPDAIAWLWQNHDIELGPVIPLSEDRKLAFKKRKTDYRKHIVTRTFKPYKRRKGGKTSYHLVMVTPRATLPSDFACKHCMAVAEYLHPGTKISWLSDNDVPAEYLSHIIGLIT